MISLTSKMLKEEENETIAKSYTDWRNKRESSTRPTLHLLFKADNLLL